MKKTYATAIEMIARFVRWMVVGVLSIIVAIPGITSISSYD